MAIIYIIATQNSWLTMESWGIVGGGQKGAQIFALLGYPVLTYIQLGTSQSDLKTAGFLTIIPSCSRKRCSQKKSNDEGFPLPIPRSYGYGSIPINTIFSGMNIHLPAILMWTTGVQGFDTLPY